MSLEHGVFTVSLDFELYWGVRDKRSLEQYQDNLKGVREVLPELLRKFRQAGIHATWATVGFLFFTDLTDLNNNLPKTLPSYSNDSFSPYKYIKTSNHLDPTYHFAPDLIDLIQQQEGQEIGTHTFSHYYCLEEGQSLAQFEADLASALDTARNRKGITVTSLAFPRNQWKSEYLAVLRTLGIRCYRGNPPNWMYRASDEAGQSLLQRAFRLADAYLDLTGPNTYALEEGSGERPFNFPASRFLRPYSRRLDLLDGLRLRRITKAMDEAALHHKIFHLWWHPHNFGVNRKNNLQFLDRILEHYQELEQKFGMKSLNMGELSLLPGRV